MDVEQARAFATVGGPDTVAEQAQAFLDAGLDGLLFNMPDAHELEPVAARRRSARAALPLRRAVDRGA